MIKTNQVKQVIERKNMKLNIKNSLRALLFVPVLAFAVSAAAAPSAGAAGPLDSGALESRNTDSQAVGNLSGEDGLFKRITTILLYIIGAISVIMIVVGGIRYVISSGDASQVTAAKNTILYAVVGLIIAILAFAIVNFVSTQINT